MADTYQGIYAPFLAEYSSNAQQNAEALLSRTASRLPVNQVPSVFLYQDSRNLLRTIHHIHQVDTPFGQPPTPLTDMYLGFYTDIHNGIAQVLQVPISFFSTTGNIAVPTSEALTVQLAAANNGMVGPFNHNDPDTEIINTRRAVPIPHAYVGLILHRTLTPMEAWQQLGQQIILDGREQDCSILINFLRAATVVVRGQGRAQPDQPPSTVQAVALLPPIDGPIPEHIHEKLCLFLPGAFTPVAPGDAQAIADGLAGIRADRLLEREAAAEAAATAAEVAAAPKSFSEMFPSNAASIRRLCLVGHDDDLLPEFWRNFAANKGKKGPGMSNFSQLTLQRSKAPDSARVCPIVSTALYVNISAFELGATDLQVITQGVSPFLMCPEGYIKANETTMLNRQYMMLQGEHSQPALSDINQLVPSTAYNIPEDLYALADFIGAYSIVWDILVGVHHPLAVALRHHHRFWVDTTRKILKAIPEDHLRNVIIIGTLRCIQLEVLEYVNTIMYEDNVVPLPDFDDIEKSLKKRLFHHFPGLPAAYTRPAKPPSKSKLPLPPYSPNNPVPPTGRPPVFGGGNEVTAPTTERVQTFLDAFETSEKSIQELRNIPRQPRVKNALALCLSYHLKGSCFDQCRRAKTHRKLLKEEEDVMQTFITKNL